MLEASIHIIDYKRISLTNDEYSLYLDICKSYDRTNFKGSELFKGLFETNDQGIIVFLKPPREKYTSLECWLFIASVMQQQHIRIMYQQVEDFCSILKNDIQNLKGEIIKEILDRK